MGFDVLWFVEFGHYLMLSCVTVLHTVSACWLGTFDFFFDLCSTDWCLTLIVLLLLVDLFVW